MMTEDERRKKNLEAVRRYQERNKDTYKKRDRERARERRARERSNRSSPIRRSSTMEDLAARRDALLAITSEMQPMTVRQVFYQASVRGCDGRDDCRTVTSRTTRATT
jgi:hypothetical protein